MSSQFDFVIVGAGSAGCALAYRLAKNNKYSVVLVEAGGVDNSPWIHIPVGYFKTMGNPKFDWKYATQPDEGINGRSVNWPRGKVLGGSSSINGLLYVRGQRQDYDHWRQLGNEGWGYDDVLPCFKRAENWEDGENEYRGEAGPLNVEKTRLSRPAIDAYVKAALNAGYKNNEDYNGEDQEGMGYFQLTTKKGRRCSSAKAYLSLAKKYKNLTVMTRKTTQKVLLQDKKAVGIAVCGRGETQEIIMANKEVILCAGAINSPQILMLSGIGPAQELKEHSIPVVVDLSGVGQNLQDHLQARPIFKCKSSSINTQTNSIFKQAKIGLEYMCKGTGPLTMAASLGTGYLKTRDGLETPDIQFHLQPFSTDRVGTTTHNFDAFTASVLQLRPESRGWLKLKSNNIQDKIMIYPNYLSQEIDCQTIVEGIRIARKIARVEPAKAEIVEEYAPGEHIEDNDYDGLLDWARQTATTIYHPTGNL